MGNFPSRYREESPEGYPDLTLKIRINPTGKEFDALLEEDGLGVALVQAYAGTKVDAYGVTFDFSTADAAIATLENQDIPLDLRAWLRDAPYLLVLAERDSIQKKLRGR